MSKDTSVIPPGPYCYERLEPAQGTDRLKVINLCPYWSRNPEKHKQENGSCSFLEINDWDEGTLLWDQVKECGISDDEVR